MRHRLVCDVMTCGPVCQAPGASVRDACRRMAEEQCGSVLIVDQGRLLGIFTECDAIRRVFACARDPDRTMLAEVMTRDPDTISPYESLEEAIRRMDEFGYRHLPVVDGQRVVGMLALRDLPIEELAAMHAELEYRHAFAERAW